MKQEKKNKIKVVFFFFGETNRKSREINKKKKLVAMEAILGKPDCSTSGLRREGCFRILV